MLEQALVQLLLENHADLQIANDRGDTIFSGMNIHLPAILGFTRYQGFDTLPYNYSKYWTIQGGFLFNGRYPNIRLAT